MEGKGLLADCTLIDCSACLTTQHRTFLALTCLRNQKVLTNFIALSAHCMALALEASLEQAGVALIGLHVEDSGSGAGGRRMAC